MFKRIADSIEMSFDIPDSEKDVAEEAKAHFEAVINAVKLGVDHLDHIYNPFVEHTDISVESVVENRGMLQGRYSTKVKENFNTVKKHALMAIRKLNTFSNGDSAIRELISTFEESVGDVELYVSKFLDILKNDYESPEFREKVVETIDKIKSNAERLDDLVYDRIIDHIDTNILTKSWMHDIDVDVDIDINLDEEHIPLIVELFNEREKELNGDFPAAEKTEQSLNMSDAQRMLFPNFMERGNNIGNFGE